MRAGLVAGPVIRMRAAGTEKPGLAPASRDRIRDRATICAIPPALIQTMRFFFPLLALVCLPAWGAAVPVVKTRALSELAIHPQRVASAQAVSLNLAKVSAELAGRIDSIPVEPGQRISKGATLATLACADFRIAAQRTQAALASAQARLQLAQQQFRRNEELAARNFISAAALDARRSELDVAHAEVRLNAAAQAAAHRDVGKCTVKSPYPAIVETRLAQVGEWASPGTPIVELWDTSRLQLSARIQQSDAVWLSQAHPVFVSEGREYPVKLLRLSPAVNPVARTREARYRFEHTLPLPGSQGVLRWQDPRAFLPADYVVWRDGQPGVFVVEKTTARFVPLPGAQEGRPVPADALAGTARVITDGRFALRHGMTVAPH